MMEPNIWPRLREIIGDRSRLAMIGGRSGGSEEWPHFAEASNHGSREWFVFDVDRQHFTVSSAD
jgi:hypothetical protein